MTKIKIKPNPNDYVTDIILDCGCTFRVKPERQSDNTIEFYTDFDDNVPDICETHMSEVMKIQDKLNDAELKAFDKEQKNIYKENVARIKKQYEEDKKEIIENYSGHEQKIGLLGLRTKYLNDMNDEKRHYENGY